MKKPPVTISCVTNRIRFLPVTKTGRCSKFNSISYKEDWHKLRVIGRKYRLPDTMSRISEIFISGAVLIKAIGGSGVIFVSEAYLKVLNPAE